VGNMGRTCNLLIVDDDFGQAVLVEALLKTLELPHRCHHVTNGALALRFLQKQAPYEGAPRPELILLDLNMPGKNGYEVLREIKSDPNLRSIPVIMLSSSPRSEDVAACYQERANAYIRKADDLGQALQVISSIDTFWLQTVELVVEG
jgi:chemotaxis family two-component system response regulator Rcp1